MAQLSESERIGASAADVWKIIGGFNDLPRWVPVIENSQTAGSGVGAVRTLRLADGGVVKERLESYDEGRSYSYSIIESDLPLTDYLATLEVAADGPESCVVTWSSTFQPDGAPEEEVTDLLEGLYLLGLETLREQIAG